MVAPTKKTGTNVVPMKSSNAPANLREFIDDDAGKGVSTSQDDQVMPLVRLIQSNSPELKKSHEKFVKGAVAGDILLRNSSEPLISGEEGFEFQLCYFIKTFIEWVPRKKGGGFVARHAEMPADAVKREVEDDDGSMRVRWVRKNGNEVIETREHYGLVNGEPYMLPMTSTGHTVSRQLMTLLNQFRTAKGAPEPAFARKFKFTTVERTKNSNTWSTWKFEDLGYVTVEEYRRGKMLHDNVAAGVVKAAAPDAEDTGEEDTPF